MKPVTRVFGAMDIWLWVADSDCIVSNDSKLYIVCLIQEYFTVRRSHAFNRGKIMCDL